MVARAIVFVLSLQSDHGEIRWAAPGPEAEPDDALLTGNCSIYKSIACAILIAETLGEDVSAWRTARARLGEAIAAKPERFDRTWENEGLLLMDGTTRC